MQQSGQYDNPNDHCHGHDGPADQVVPAAHRAALGVPGARSTLPARDGLVCRCASSAALRIEHGHVLGPD